MIDLFIAFKERLARPDKESFFSGKENAINLWYVSSWMSSCSFRSHQYKGIHTLSIHDVSIPGMKMYKWSSRVSSLSGSTETSLDKSNNNGWSVPQGNLFNDDSRVQDFPRKDSSKNRAEKRRRSLSIDKRHSLGSSLESFLVQQQNIYEAHYTSCIPFRHTDKILALSMFLRVFVRVS